MFLKNYLSLLLLISGSCQAALVNNPATNAALPGVARLVAVEESAHFVAHSAHDATASKNILELLELYHDAIVAELGCQLPDKLDVYIYPSQDEFCQAMEREDRPAWYIGGVKHGAIHMVTPSNMGAHHSLSSALRLIVQRFATLVLFEKLKSVENKPPFWFVRGLAVRATRHTPYWPEYLKAASLQIAQKIQADEVPEFSMLNDPAQGEVVFSHAVLEYLINQYNLTDVQVLELFSDFSKFFDVTKITLEDFEKKWQDSLQVNENK